MIRGDGGPSFGSGQPGPPKSGTRGRRGGCGAVGGGSLGHNRRGTAAKGEKLQLEHSDGVSDGSEVLGRLSLINGDVKRDGVSLYGTFIFLRECLNVKILGINNWSR